MIVLMLALLNISSILAANSIALKDAIDLASVAFAGIALILSIKAIRYTADTLKEDRNARYAEVVTNVYFEIHTLERKVIESKQNGFLHNRNIYSFLNALSRIIQFVETEKYPDDLIGYLRDYFQFGLYLYQNKIRPNDREKSGFKRIEVLCTTKGWSAEDRL